MIVLTSVKHFTPLFLGLMCVSIANVGQSFRIYADDTAGDLLVDLVPSLDWIDYSRPYEVVIRVEAEEALDEASLLNERFTTVRESWRPDLSKFVIAKSIWLSHCKPLENVFVDEYRSAYYFREKASERVKKIEIAPNRSSRWAQDAGNSLKKDFLRFRLDQTELLPFTPPLLSERQKVELRDGAIRLFELSSECARRSLTEDSESFVEIYGVGRFPDASTSTGFVVRLHDGGKFDGLVSSYKQYSLKQGISTFDHETVEESIDSPGYETSTTWEVHEGKPRIAEVKSSWKFSVRQPPIRKKWSLEWIDDNEEGSLGTLVEPEVEEILANDLNDFEERVGRKATMPSFESLSKD